MKHCVIRNEDVLVNGESIPIFDKVDVLILGGGIAGVLAASAAGREKAKVIVVEKTAFLAAKCRLEAGGR